MYSFNSHYLHMESFHGYEGPLTLGKTYYGKEFMKYNDKAHFKVIHKKMLDMELYVIPNKKDFLKSVEKMNDDMIIVKIIFKPTSMIFVDSDKTLYVNNINAIIATNNEWNPKKRKKNKIK